MTIGQGPESNYVIAVHWSYSQKTLQESQEQKLDI